ncbi:MAG: hypothetical protein M3O46_23020 [Myxococcota bacterium]|nr:hypothetical protein [Myxococcota bacterium]
MSDADADLLFTPDKGIGLSLLRVRIAPDGSCLEVATAQKAIARGAVVWATPWSPPAIWKSNGNLNYGGSLLPQHADDWAKVLVAFSQTMRSSGVPIDYLSAQNEPTMGNVDYESCVYTPTALHDFITNHLGPAFVGAGLTTKIIAPETVGWGPDELFAFGGTILGDPLASNDVGIIATHSYSGNPSAYPQVAQAGKELWQTEVYDQSKTADPGMGSALRVALMMHTALVDASVNAWHYWWIYPRTTDNGALWDKTTALPAKRLYAMGNFSRFVRPGYYRVQTTAMAPHPGISFSAYYDPAPSGSGQLVIVAINENDTAASQRFLFDGVNTGSWKSWVTSAGEDLVSSGISVDGGIDLVYALEPKSVTTLQGVVTGPGPAVAVDIAPIQSQSGGNASGCACSSARGGRAGIEGPFLSALLAFARYRRLARAASRCGPTVFRRRTAWQRAAEARSRADCS